MTAKCPLSTGMEYRCKTHPCNHLNPRKGAIFYFLLLIQSPVIFGAQKKRDYFLLTGRMSFPLSKKICFFWAGSTKKKHAKQELYAWSEPFWRCNWATTKLYYPVGSIARIFIRAIAYECDTLCNTSKSSQRVACVCGHLPISQW